MKFEPKTEAEINEAGLWPADVYDFEVAEARDTQSKAGNDMAELKVRLHNSEGKTTTVFDYLVSTSGMAYKIRHFAEAVGLLAEYEKGELVAADMMGRTGKCKVIIQKDKTGAYPDKNGISDYVVGGPSKPIAQQADAELDDEIPFS